MIYSNETENLRIAVQKTGRLSEKSLTLIEETGIRLTQEGKLKLVSVGQNFPVEILFLRDNDIPQYVADNVADIGIVGENEVMEKDKPVDIIDRLGFARCRLSLAIPQSLEYKGLSFFNGKKIATTYPKILQKFLNENKIEAEIHEISGSVEIAPSIGLADAIFDIVSSGSTLISNRLKEVEVVCYSEAVVIGNSKMPESRKRILQQLLFRIHAVLNAKNNKYILLNAPNESLENITAVLPGMKSPTIMPLAEKGWSSLHSVVNENEFWDIIKKLKEYGAQGILVIPIEKMIV
ncbi:MAG TPA: ATP phosphoribosyltransferase [Bacteroidales bacterium]|nr:ATP phosphoribosyltransferase [Bacteroidales bacterium]